MKRPLNKGRTRFRYGENKRSDLSASLWKSVERFQTLGLRMAGFLHQFKTPLQVIQSQTEYLLDDPALPSRTRASLDLIRKNAGKLTSQTGSMMELARGTTPAMEKASLGPLIEDIVHTAEIDCRRNKIVLEKNILPDLFVSMDALALEGAIHNLVNNAIEAMPNGGLLRIRTFETSRRRVALEICDSGAGMNSATRRRVLHTPLQTSKANGTGLGLYITKHILRRHKASFRLESKLGEGTTVTILFPMAINSSFPAASGREPINKETMDPRQGHSGRTPAKSLWHKVLHVFALLTVMIAPLAAAHVPQLLRLKGRFTDSQKVPLSDTLPIHFSIWDTEDGYGNLLWQDVQDTAIQENTFQVVLGRSKPLPPSVFSGGDRWLEMQIANDSPLRPRHKIPYQFIQAQVAIPPAAPPAPVVAVPPPPVMTAEEKRDLELQIEKYKAEPAEEAPKPVARAKPPRRHKPPVQASTPAAGGELASTYSVQSGDTLKSIAQKLYGNAELWYDLYYLNRDRLGPMGHLFPGQILVLPTQTPAGAPHS